MMPRRGTDIRRVALWGGKLLLAAALLLLIADSIQAHALAPLLHSARPVFLLAALLLLPLNLWLQLHKWRLLVHSRFPGVPAADLRASLLLGFTFGVVTPARLGEFGGRAAGFRASALRRTDIVSLVGLTAVDKFATMVVTVALGVPGLLLFAWRHPFMDSLSFGLLLAVAVLLPAAALLLMRRASTSSARAVPSATLSPTSETVSGAGSGLRASLQRRWTELRETLRGVDRARRLRLLAYSGLFYLTFLLQFFFLLSAFGPVQPLSALAGIGTIMLLKTVIPPVTLGELGIREGASVIVLGHAGILPAAAFNASLLLFAVNLLLPALAGLALLLWIKPAHRGGTRVDDPVQAAAARTETDT